MSAFGGKADIEKPYCWHVSHQWTIAALRGKQLRLEKNLASTERIGGPGDRK